MAGHTESACRAQVCMGVNRRGPSLADGDVLEQEIATGIATVGSPSGLDRSEAGTA